MCKFLFNGLGLVCVFGLLLVIFVVLLVVWVVALLAFACVWFSCCWLGWVRCFGLRYLVVVELALCGCCGMFICWSLG